nr:MAG TPA: hypothetical protein [Caudoviricetes sp.]
MYQNDTVATSKEAASRRRKSQYLGSARRFPPRICVSSVEATVFKGHCPAAPIIRCMNFPTAAGGGIAGQNSTGHDGPDRKHEEGTSPVNCRH